MTTLKKEHAALIDAFKAFNSNVAANNQRKVSDCAQMLADEKVFALVKSQEIKAQDFNVALYTAEKAIKMFHAMTRDTIDARNFELNTFCAMRTAQLALAVGETVTVADMNAAIVDKKATARAHVYRRNAFIAAQAQVNYSHAALRLMKVIDSATLKARDCEALQLFAKVSKDMIVQ